MVEMSKNIINVNIERPLAEVDFCFSFDNSAFIFMIVFLKWRRGSEAILP